MRMLHQKSKGSMDTLSCKSRALRVKIALLLRKGLCFCSGNSRPASLQVSFEAENQNWYGSSVVAKCAGDGIVKANHFLPRCARKYIICENNGEVVDQSGEYILLVRELQVVRVNTAIEFRDCFFSWKVLIPGLTTHISNKQLTCR